MGNKHSDLGIIADAMILTPEQIQERKAVRTRTHVTVSVTFLPDKIGIEALRSLDDAEVRSYVIMSLMARLNLNTPLGKVRIDAVEIVRGKR